MANVTCPNCRSELQLPPNVSPGSRIECPLCNSAFAIGGSSQRTQVPPIASRPALPPPAQLEVGCPKCRQKLMVESTDVGSPVECPFCQTIFKADSRSSNSSPRQIAPSAREEEDRPRTKSTRDDEDDDDYRPRRRRSRDDDDDDDEDYRPRKTKRRGRNRYREAEEIVAESTTTMIFGLLLMFCCALAGLILGIKLIKKGHDASQLSDGELGGTQMIVGWVIVIFSGLNMIAGAVLKIMKVI